MLWQDKIFNKCLANPALHLKEHMLLCLILCFFYIILSRLSIILICSLSDPLAVNNWRQRAISFLSSPFITRYTWCQMAVAGHFMTYTSFILLYNGLTHLSISQVSINPRFCFCHRPEKRNFWIEYMSKVHNWFRLISRYIINFYKILHYV